MHKLLTADHDVHLPQDAELFELRLQRDQARTQVNRLKERLTELFGGDAADLSIPLPPSARHSGAATSTSRTATGRSSSGGGAVTGAREAELLSTITALKSALEKATASSTPTTKYMAVSGDLDEWRQPSQLGETWRRLASSVAGQGLTEPHMLCLVSAGGAEA